MALKDIVVISPNRRDDVLGYLALPELNAEGKNTTGYETSGNYRILDHLEVLKWVQRNIANFRGDPNRVTIAGQSLSSSQVYHAVNSKLFSGLFHGAKSESGIRYPYYTLLAGLATSYVTMDEALQFGANYTATHNVSALAALRKLSMEEVFVGSNSRVENDSIWWVTALSANYPSIFRPVLDGYLIPDKDITELPLGPTNDVPLITGNTKGECGASTTKNYTVAQYDYCRSLKYDNLSSRDFQLYPAGNEFTSASSSWNNAASDTSKVSSWAHANDWIKGNATSPIYTYYWDHAPPGRKQCAFHQSEIMYVLNALYANADTHPFTAYDYYLAEVMSGYWANFVRKGNPDLRGAYTRGDLTHCFSNDRIDFVMCVGDGFGNNAVADPLKVSLMVKYSAQQSPY